MNGPHYDINPRQWRFVEEYLIDLNGTQAATRAGYAPESAHVTASRLLKNANVAAEIERLQRGNSYELGQMRTDVILGLKQIADDGNDRAALRALELLAKHLGMFNKCCNHCIQSQKEAARARIMSVLSGALEFEGAQTN